MHSEANISKISDNKKILVTIPAFNEQTIHSSGCHYSEEIC